MALTMIGVGCGDDDGGPRSADEVVARLESPTGHVDEASVRILADKVSVSVDVGLRAHKGINASFDAELDCPRSGRAAVRGESNETRSEVTFDYDNCCSSLCCVNGSGTTFLGRTEGGYSSCSSYDIEASCGASTGSLSVSCCLGARGDQVRSVRINGETFTVSASGSFSGGTGRLQITGRNGTFMCDYSAGSGSCSGSAEFSF